MQQMKQRREDRKKIIEEEKQHKKDLLNAPNYIPKLDFEYLVNQQKSQIQNTEPDPIHFMKARKFMYESGKGLFLIKKFKMVKLIVLQQ